MGRLGQSGPSRGAASDGHQAVCEQALPGCPARSPTPRASQTQTPAQTHELMSHTKWPSGRGFQPKEPPLTTAADTWATPGVVTFPA